MDNSDRIPECNQPTTLDSDFLTPTEAAEWLRVSLAVLANFRLSGEGPLYFQPGGPRTKVWYRRRDLLAWIESGPRGGRESAGQVDESAVEK